MCGKANSDVNDTLADSIFVADPVPLPALVAALMMLAVGIVIVASYGWNRKLAWRPEQTHTFAMPDLNRCGVDQLPPAGSDDLDLESQGSLVEPPVEEAVTGLDDGLSNTLKTSLLTE